MKKFLAILLVFHFAPMLAQTDRNYRDNALSNPDQYSGLYTVAPFEGWQVSPSFEIKILSGKAEVRYLQPSESPEPTAKAALTVLKNVSVKNNVFRSDKYNGRFVTVMIPCSKTDSAELEGLLIEPDNYFFVKHVIIPYASTTLTEPNRPPDFYSPKNVLLQQYSAYVSCLPGNGKADGPSLQVPASTLPEFYSGAGTWAEGAAGPGIGEWLKFEFTQPMQPSKIRLFAGYSKSKDLYTKNARPKKLKISASDKSSFEVELKDIFEEQEFELSLKKPVSWIRLEILDVYKGTRYEDCCISRVIFDF